MRRATWKRSSAASPHGKAMSARPLIIGTAGHIDHGKTSLVRTLTGVNLDRLPEERERGITIALGFTHLSLGGDRRAAFVDVPGHEKLVRTMIAGATGLDAVILVVAANEGVMPQTREHLAILSLLGVARGFVVLTKCDLVDEETREFAELDVMDAVTGTFLEGAPILGTALTDTPEGIDRVLEQLVAIADDPDRSRNSTDCFRLPIDRAFIQRGFGTVVTGTATGKPIKDGAQVWIQPLGISSRVRGLQVHGEAVTTTEAGQRVAANLAGIERDDLARGMVVVSNQALTPASMLDVSLQMLPGAASIPAGGHVRLLVGTAEVLAVADPIGQDALNAGQHQWVQLRTETPILALPGDRFIIRRESPMETLGGGIVLDPWAPRAKRKNHPAIVADLVALSDGDKARLLLRAGLAGMTPEQAQVRGHLTGTTLGDRLLHPEHITTLSECLCAALSMWHKNHPLDPGAPRRALHSGALAALTERAFDALIAKLVEDDTLAVSGPTVRMSGFSVQLDSAQKAAHDQMVSTLADAGLEGERFDILIKSVDGLLQLLIDNGTAIRVGERVVAAARLNDLSAQIQTYFTGSPRLTPSDFKALTGLSRRTAIPLLEWLDSQGITRRDGDARVAG